MPSGELPDATIDELVAALDGSGLDAASVVCAGALTEPDDDSWKRRVAHLRFTIRFAARVGASCVLVCPGDLLGATRPAAIERTALALRAGLEDAHEHAVDLAIEPLRPIHTDFVNTLPQALEIVAAVDDPRCGVCMDTFQVWRGDPEHEVVIDEIVEAAPHTKIVQVADSRVEPRSREDRLVPGEGVLPLDGMLGALFATGDDGSPSRSCPRSCGRPITTTSSNVAVSACARLSRKRSPRDPIASGSEGTAPEFRLRGWCGVAS